MSEHDFVFDQRDGAFIPSCTCGWEGIVVNRESDAFDEWEDHRTGAESWTI